MLSIDNCLQQLMSLQGVLGARLIDYLSGSTIGAAGRGPDSGEDLTDAGAAGMIYATMQAAAFATVGQPQHVEDIVITAGNGYHLLHLLPTGIQARIVLYIWLDRTVGNLAVAQRRLHAITAQFSAD